jgi:hemolysin D
MVNVDDTKVPLGPGIAVAVEIRTGSRRILEYVSRLSLRSAPKQ